MLNVKLVPKSFFGDFFNKDVLKYQICQKSRTPKGGPLFLCKNENESINLVIIQFVA